MEISSESFLNQKQPKGVKKQTRPKTSKPTATSASAKQKVRPPSASTTGQKASMNSTTYKDWQVREEAVRQQKKGQSRSSANSTQRMGASSKGNGRGRKSSKSRSRSRPREVSVGTADEIRKRVKLQFDNYMGAKEEAGDDEISLLEDSTATPPRAVKKEIVQEQRHQRNRSEAERKHLELEELQKKEKALQALEMRFKSQTQTFQKQLEASRRSQERKEKAERKKGRENSNSLGNRGAGFDGGDAQNYKIGKQVTDLRSWIEDALQKEHLASVGTDSLQSDPSAQNLELPTASFASKPPAAKKTVAKRKNAADQTKKQNVNTSVLSNPSINEFSKKPKGKAKMLKHQLPGNNQLTAAEQNKLGARQDRYGVFCGSDATSEFDQVVSNQKSKMLQLNGNKNVQQQLKKDEVKQVQQVLNSALKSLGSRQNIQINEDSSQTPSEVDTESEADEGRQTSERSEDSSDKIPVRQSPPERAYRSMLNIKADEQKSGLPDDYRLPGISNTQAHFEKLEMLRKEKEAGAAGVIQKFFRGHKGRKLYSRERAKNKQRIEFEYERLNHELKSDTQYNLKTYLYEKKRLREKSGMADSISVDEIAEVIGESGSVRSHMKPMKQSQAISAQLQNFFHPQAKKEAASSKDPLSLISIFAKRNGVVPNYDKAKAHLKSEKSNSRDRSRHLKRQKNTKQQYDNDSVIEEEYSDYFTDSAPKTDSTPNEESITEEEIAKFTSSSQSTKMIKKNLGNSSGRKVSASKGSASKAGSFRRSSQHVRADFEDSVADEVIDEESFQQSKGEDSINEESIANEIESARFSREKEDSIAEDSIIKEEYDDNNHPTYNRSQQVEARNRVKFGLHSQQQEEAAVKTEADKIKSADQLKLAEEQNMKAMERNRIIGDLMGEMREFEKASLSNVMVDRMEKIMVSSLAQKDQLIMAQRLHELEAEKRHKEEINKIREEQIKLMSQLMLLGTASGQAVSSDISSKQREDLLQSIKQIVEKPIEIRKETVHVNYSVSKGPDDQLLVSDKFGVSTSMARKSYLEEYDESIRMGKKGGVVTQNQAKYQDQVEEDIQLRLGKKLDASTSGKRQYNVQESIEDLVEDATSAIEESIRDEIGDSQSKISASHVSRNNATQEGQRSKARPKSSEAEIFLREVEKTIDSERSEREEKLARDLKQRKISPRTYDRGIKEIEKWVVREKRELHQRRRKLEDNQNDIQKYVQKFKKDQKSVPMLTKISTPHNNDSAHKSYMDDSDNSEKMQTAMRQAHLLQKDLSGMSPEQKYAAKKRETALNLLEMKDKAIKKALNEKLSKYQGSQAEDLLQKALELDIEAEVERLYNKAIDESHPESARSRQSEDGRSIGSDHHRTTRTTKSVHFPKSVHTASTKPTTVSTERFRSNYIDEHSIDEMSNTYSQSMKSQSALDVSRPSRSGKQQQQQNLAVSSEKFSPQKVNQRPPVERDGSEGGESMIESDYSAEFTEQSMTSKEFSQSNNKSANKLIAKAKDIEESAAYSENFEEDSMAKSGNKDGAGGSASKDKIQMMMEAVKEESVDDSAHEMSKDVTQSMGSKSSKSPGKDRIDSSLGSLPSEDITVQDSARSVEWKIEIPLDSFRQQQSEQQVDQSSDESSPVQTSPIREERVEETQDDIESSSDLNTRDEENALDDLDSCPDGVGASMSGNDDINAKADKITEELMELLMMNYKNDEEILLDKEQEQVDEDEWKDKFPWTLDKKPEPKPSPKPQGVKMGAQPTPPKTLREIKDEEFKKKHEENLKQLEGRDEKVISFLDFLCKRADLKELKQALNKPIARDPMKILSQIVNCYDEDESIDKINEDTLMMAQQQILQQGFFNRMDREYNIAQRMQINRAAVEDSDQLTVSQEEMENINNVHHYSIFESLNEALDISRPYQNKGEPMPWSKSTRVVNQVESEEQAKGVLQKARDQVIQWMKVRAGTNHAPLPDAPAQTQDEMGEEIIPPPLEDGEEDRRNLHRQEKLAELMTGDILKNDCLWVDYEIQDTQARFDVADMILHHLAGEIAEFLAVKGSSQ